ncbi:13E12 repeat family protein, partial [Klebsiella pneumoniae]|nr:13E12 repeat family protein [Klebsiella pneumoniae]
TLTQQRLDAFVAIMKRTLDGHNPGGTNRPHLVVGTDPQTEAGIAAGRAQTANGVTLPMSAVQRLACDALLTRVILDADSQPLDLGRTVRT